MGLLALRPGDSLTTLSFRWLLSIGFRDFQFPFFLLFKLRGLTLPRWDLLPLIMPAFAGRTLSGTDFSRRREPIPSC